MENRSTDIVRQMENSPIDPSSVTGWAIDADPENDPTYPMKNRNNGEHAGYTWERPPQQQTDIEVLQSNERPNLSATFGTSVPPMGISGMIRRGAFKFSESSYGHWLPLMLADRINMVEGVVEDIATGHIPNIPAEMGIKAQWQHDRTRLVTKLAIGAALATAAYAMMSRRRDNFQREAIDLGRS